MSTLSINALDALLKQNINRPADLMRERFNGVNEILAYVTPYLIQSGKMPLPRLNTGRIVTHNNGANKDAFVAKEDVMKLSNRWLDPQYGKINFALKESEILALWNSYLFKLGSYPTQTAIKDYMAKFPFEDVIYDEIAKRSYKDILDDSFKGVVGSGSDSPIDGLLSKIIAAITPASVGAPTEIPAAQVADTSNFTESNVLTELKKVFAKVAATPGALRLALDIHVAPEVEWLYNTHKEGLSKAYVPIIRDGHTVPGELPNARFVPNSGLQGTNAVIITMKENLSFGMNILPGQITMRTDVIDYDLRVYGQVHYDINFNDGRYMWVNDNLA